MKYAAAQKEILSQLVKHPDTVINVITTDDREALSIDGEVCYIFPSDTNWIDLERIAKTVNIRHLSLPFMYQVNKLEPTEHLKDKNGILAREFKKQWNDDKLACESTYVQEKHLKHFDFPTLYQNLETTKGIIAITEMTPMEGEVLVGFVLPVKFKED